MDRSSEHIDFDHNATTRPLPEVVETVAEHLAKSYGNPGSRHALGRTARKVLESSRETIAGFLGADPDELVFTSGGTEAINTAIFGCAQGKPRGIALTAGEHPATREACRKLERSGWRLHTMPIDAAGRLREEQYASLPWRELALVNVILAHNETGVVQDVASLAERCRTHVVPLHLDAVQMAGKLPLNFHKLGATLLSVGAHKFHGPRGIGALLVRKGTRLEPLLYGGHQESNRRPGTEPVALAAGMARALEIWHRERSERAARVSSLRDRLERRLTEACAPVVVNGSQEHRLPNTLNISFPGCDGEALLVALDLAGIACSLGSTCASGSTEPAAVLAAMGCPPAVQKSAVRFSLGIDNSPDDVERAVPLIAEAVRRLRGK
jgi:cysteine desulfurase